ncbi:MAG: STAS domain-containing protein, partial [Pseudomonadota bacterium]
MIVISDSKNPVPVVQIRTSRATSRLATALRAALDDLLSTSRSAALIDLSGIGRMTPSGLGALLEVYSDLQARLPIAFFDGNDRVSALTQHYGLGQVLPVYPDRDSARNSPSIAAHRLRGLKCAVLGHPEPDAALRSIGLSDLLAFDLLGCTVLQRQVRTLASFGLNNVLLWANAALSPRAPSAAGCTGQTVITLPTAGGTGAILGMRDALGDTSQPIILVEAGVLANVDFAKMLDQHISRGAWATVAVPSPASPAGPQPTNLILTPGGRLAPPGSSCLVLGSSST